MSLKETIENHPLPILVAVAIASASVASGVVAYFSSSRLDNEKLRLETEYKADISALKAKLASVERKIGNEEKTYFDVSQLMVTSDRIKQLDQGFKTAGEGAFFYSEPSGSLWKYTVISEAEFAALKLDDLDKDDATKKLLAVLGQKNIHFWRHDSQITVNPTPKKGMEGSAPKVLNFFPMVAVQIVSEKDLKLVIGSMSELFMQESELAKISASLDKLISQIQLKLPTHSASTTTTSSSAPEPTDETHRTTRTSSDRVVGEAKLEAEELLEQLFRGDMAAFMLGSIIMQTVSLSQLLSGVEGRLNTIQKKGNVVYIQMTLKFDSVKINGKDKPSSLTVDREIFLVTTSKNLYLVQVEVPSLDGRSDAYSWVGQWLSSIRIPI